MNYEEFLERLENYLRKNLREGVVTEKYREEPPDAEYAPGKEKRPGTEGGPSAASGSSETEEGMEDGEVVYSFYRETPYSRVFLDLPTGPLYDICIEESFGAAIRALQAEMRPLSLLKNSARTTEDYKEELPEEKKELFEALRALRSELSRRDRVPPYIVMSNRSLYEMTLACPKEKEDMLSLHGIGEKNYGTYGEAFLALLKEWGK